MPVPGGHIVQSIGRKDRHSKVCTAKGLRDRRVRLAAHTAIEFYDVQDRLGYDRPSMAVDWLIKNAKNAIDELDHLPPWQPTAAPPTGFQEIADPVTDSIDPFFPPDLLSRTSSHAQDLRLSLQSFQESTANDMFSFDASSAMAETGGGGGGYLDRHFFTQRGPLQSSTPPSVPPWMDPIPSPSPSSFHHPSSSLSVPHIEFGSGSGGGFSGFRIPSWIHGAEEHDKPGSNFHH